MQSGAGPRPSLLSQPTIGIAPEAHPVRGVDLSAQMLTFHNIHLGVLVWRLKDLRDVRSLRFLKLNGAAERELEMSAREAVRKVIAEAFPALMRTNLPDRCRTVVASGKPESIGEMRCADPRDQEIVSWFDPAIVNIAADAAQVCLREVCQQIGGGRGPAVSHQ